MTRGRMVPVAWNHPPCVLLALVKISATGGTCGSRTRDPRIKSPLLYQLS